MKLTLEQFRESSIDYLYGELEGDARRAFEACLAESQAYRDELEALARTLDLSRQALRGARAQEPPARVREAVLAAAAAQRPRPAGAISRLRIHWLAPALAVAAMVGLVVLRERGAPAVGGEVDTGAEQRAVPAAPEAKQAPPPSEQQPAFEVGMPRDQPPAAAAPASAEPLPVRSRAGRRAASGGAARTRAWEPARESESAKAAAAKPAPAPPPSAARATAPYVDSSPAPARDELVQRASNRFAQHRWAEAVTAYRALLRRFPDDPAAPQWRTQLARAQGALRAAGAP